MSRRRDCARLGVLVLLARARPRPPRAPERERIVPEAPPRAGFGARRARAARPRRRCGARVRRHLRPRPARRTKRSSSASRSGSRCSSRAALIVDGKRADRRRRRSRRTTPPTSIPRSRRSIVQSVEESGSRPHAQAAVRRSPSAAPAAPSALAAVAPLASLGPVLDTDLAATGRRGGAAVASSTRGPAVRRSDIEQDDLLHRLPRGRRQGGARLADRPRAPRPQQLRPAARAERLRRRGDRRVLEDLHPRGLRDLAVPRAALPRRRAEAGPRLPVPLLDVRPGRRRHGHLRARRAASCRCCRSRSTATRQPPRRAATSTLPSGRRGGASACGGRTRDPPQPSASSTSARATRRSCGRHCATSSRTTGRSCSARSRSTHSSSSSRRGSTWRSSSPTHAADHLPRAVRAAPGSR